ncbi:EamA family transporter [Methylophilus rhizosphaerae]|uniref:EamA family transporter n=1 Tax=Methylophilus rhizosphaerae TaxID=492660 RepID=UPI003CCBAF1A
MAYSCWNYSIQHGNLALLATMSYFTPLLSVLLTSLWLGVAPGAGFMYGVGLVTLGSLLIGRASQ